MTAATETRGNVTKPTAETRVNRRVSATVSHIFPRFRLRILDISSCIKQTHKVRPKTSREEFFWATFTQFRQKAKTDLNFGNQ